jgi:hypothetical protein
MQDAVSLIGKKLTIGEEIFEIMGVHFVPHSTHPKHDIYFSLKITDKGIVNYSYDVILPYFKTQIKL